MNGLLWRQEFEMSMARRIFADMKDRKLLNSELGRMDAKAYRAAEPSGICLVLDNIRSAYNVGSMFRSADAFHADKMVLCGICAAPPSAEIHKTALGAENVVPWEHVSDTLAAMEALRSEGYTIVAVEQTEHSIKIGPGAGSTFETHATLGSVRGGTASAVGSSACETVEKVDPAPDAAKYAFVLGNEVDGVQQAVVDACDFAIEIPQHGTKHSLNVAVAAGIVLFAFSR